MDATKACRINALPDWVLLHILCFLPIKIAVRTSVLSNRWRYLWTYFPSLEFDHKDFPLSVEEAVRCRSPIDGADLFTVLNQFLLSHAVRLHSFKLSLTLKNVSERRLLGRWIHHIFAAKKVEEVDLKIFLSVSRSRFKLPLPPFSCPSILNLRLSRCYFDPQEGSEVVFSHLRSLRLHDIRTNLFLLSRMISACPQLENLTFDYVSSKTVEEMHIFIPKLIKLRILCSQFTNIRITSPLLQFLEFDCRRRFIDKACLSKIQGNLIHLKDLKACTCFFEAFSKTDTSLEQPEFNELEVIVIRPCSRKLGFENVAPLLGNSPLLRSLYIENCSSLSFLNDDAVDESSVGVHPNLLKMNGTQSEMKLLKYVLKNAPCMEFVRIQIVSMDVLVPSAMNELLLLQKLYLQLELKLFILEKKHIHSDQPVHLVYDT